jgi:hypothetical protein
MDTQPEPGTVLVPGESDVVRNALIENASNAARQLCCICEEYSNWTLK